MPLPIQLLPGQIFARDFRILAPLAEGGMGAVYVVEQLSTGKKRALKVMLPQLVSDQRARERFQQEARIGSQIESEHVVEVVSAGIEDGAPWLAMELLEGHDLSAMVRERGPLPPAEVYEILQQLGDGLGAAHARGIVHRDLKPENLFIAISRRRGVPFTLKMLDFGIAKLTQESRATASSTAAVGSPMWMAPEQTEQHARLRPATDVWALGLVVFHVLTGRFYWRVANQAEVRLTALFTEVLVTPIDPATMRAAHLGVGHLIPHGFDAWFARCLERDPERRWPDARAAIAALTPQLGLREGAGGAEVPVTMSQPAAAAPRAVAATVPMSAVDASQAGVPAPPGPYAQGSYAHGAYAQPSQVPYAQPSQVPYAQPSQVPYPQPSHLAPPQAHAGTTPYAVHGPSTATGAVARPAPRGRGGILVLGLFAVLIGAAMSAFGGLVLVQTLASGGGGGGGPLPPPRRDDAGTIALAPIDAGLPVGVDLGESDAGATADSGTGTGTGTGTGSGSEGTATPAARFAWADGTMQTFRGTWSGQGWRYQITLQLNRNGSELAGTISWRLLETSSAAHQHRVGDHAEEWVTGTWSESGAMRLDGYQTSDPSLINPDHYDLRVTGAGAVSGRSRSDGGRVSARVVR